ncbi:poly-gamma-glutamate hydrolase family protein [Staphylococcus pseudoxylosus]|uniref:poly-gamma-glutamate hydrolase family protein n=1 Tax=Staphylococcus pseudoxylosus TaxID=2282419 RepID=UPI00298F2D56|nr:poly-gamma-glutamate hydrolase family protein [Staphylococcus pseudoxylosus]MDW8546605.1 poly-gamma-glutamate hydrolase family protein [Staphylococcus pseudoxylosus]
MADKYNSMSELEAETIENKDWEVVTRDLDSQVIITAIHGGGIEPGTTEIADLTAQKGEYDYFSFKGTKSKGNEDLHVTSRNYDQSVLMEMIKNKTYAVAIHGCEGDENIINCCKTGAGVQLELTPGLRKMCFDNQKYNKKSREDQHNWSQFMDEFTTTIVKTIQNIQS